MVCNKCGAQIPDDAQVCPKCGVQQQVVINGDDAADAQQNKVVAIIGYFGILFLVPLLAAPNSRFARYHANQALVLFICEAILGVVAGILAFALAFVPIAGPIIGGLICGAVGIVSLIFMILGIVAAAGGEKKPLPIIGGITILK